MLVTLARPLASRALLPAWSSIHVLAGSRAANSTLSGAGLSNGTLNPWQEDSEEPLTPFPAGISMSDDPADFPEALYSGSLVHGRASLPAPRHPISHGIPSATLHLRSYHLSPLTRFTGVVYHAAAALGIPLSNVAMLPTQRTLWTVPKSPFVHKGAQENFERKTHKRAIKAWDTDPEVVERWVRFLMQHSEGGVGMRVVRWERAPVGIGAKALESVQRRMEEGKRTKEKIEKLGGKIVEREMEALGQEGVQAKA